MSFIVENRTSDSSFVETVMHGHTAGEGVAIRPAECNWHMVLVRVDGQTQFRVVGPHTRAGELPYIEGVELLWIKLRLGVFMPHLPVADFRDDEITLPDAASTSFWLKGSAWQFPNYENADAFVARLLREDILAHDPVVDAVLQGQLAAHAVAARTLRHRFQHATGLSHNDIHQIQRAQRAAALLQHGVPILDAVDELGYYDQPHLTRALKRWVGHTPAQIAKPQAGM
jgi:AraC-like DNA-binding protein